MSGKPEQRSTPPLFEPPPIQADAQAYWDAAADGRLLIKRCDECGEAHFYPREICPFCASRHTTWVESRGEGRIYSYTVVRRGLPEPQTIAYVTLEEGPTLLGEVQAGEVAELAIGRPVQADFVRLFGERPFLIFRLTRDRDRQAIGD